ncbi:MAG: hypothetical protein PHT49_05555 [Desulfovibrionales bacterium]|nr:hypothetical protein [Desulfovibrionales bacterium]
MLHIAEPRLTFGFGQKLTDPRDGIMLFGPYTREKIRGQLNVGIIGPHSCRAFLKSYLRRLHKPIYGDGEVARPFFPGLEAAYGVSVNFANLPELDVPQDKIAEFLRYTDGHQRVHNLSNLYTDRLIRYQKQEEMPVNVWFVVIPDEIYTYGRPKSRVPASRNNIKLGLSKSERQAGQVFLFDYLNELREAYDFEINFHNQLKAKLLGEKVVTQVVRASTVAYDEIWEDKRRIAAERKFDTAKAWNISTTLYYKAGGLPWRLGDVRNGVCYLGLVYKKTHTEDSDRNACCAAQMFLDSGDGVVFRGNVGPWYNPATKEFHIRRVDAHDLLRQSIDSFKERDPAGIFPKEVFIHAKTNFDDEEWNGFVDAAEGKTRLVGVRIRENRVMKLYRDFEYSVPRGTALILGDAKAYLWTKGYIPRIQTQLGLETPNPLEIEITRGSPQIQTVCRDILALTKLNYNTCLFGEGLPVTLRFADRIGDVLTAGRDVESGVLPFKHYV